jgi:4-aminobutyrate aminotransferase / (S)-3-amino-2-methylpropionate transaminase / 5-aminovalerate transaminase
MDYIHTKYRTIVSEIPHPDSLSILKNLFEKESRSTHGQPPVIWDRAQGFQVFDPYGNVFLDFSAGVLVANCGHSHPRVLEAIRTEVNRGLVFSYCFPNSAREKLLSKLDEVTPESLRRYYLLSTGAEATETSLKLARTWGSRTGIKNKKVIISFEASFHGRTLGAQQMGGFPEAKEWIGDLDEGFIQVPFPDDIYNKNLSFDVFSETIRSKGILPENVAGVMVETYQGGIVSFAPVDYMKQLREWCDGNDALLMFDEVQAGFGRNGKWWGFEHYGVTPDLIACGKGISGGLPLSAVIGRDEIMQQYGHGMMTTTHGGNPLSCAASAASIGVIQDENLVENSKLVGAVLLNELQNLNAIIPDRIRAIAGKGLVAGIHIKKMDSDDPDGDFANAVVWECVNQGLLMFAPVGPGGATIKISPPLTITEDAVIEGVGVIIEAVKKIVSKESSN